MEKNNTDTPELITGKKLSNEPEPHITVTRKPESEQKNILPCLVTGEIINLLVAGYKPPRRS